MKKLSIGLAVGMLPLMAGLACGQVATPPPGPKPEQPTYVPPPPPAPAPAATPGAQRTGGASVQTAQRQRLPEIPYVPLEAVYYTDPIDLVALQPNPTVGQTKVPDLMPMLAGRRSRIEAMAMENFDFAVKVMDGLIEEVNLSDIPRLTAITDMIKPLVPPKSISQEMVDRGLLSRVQFEFNQKIMREYQAAMNEGFAKEFGDGALNEFMRFLMRESVKETMNAIDGMLVESTWRMGDVLAKAGLAETPTGLEMAALSSTPEDPIEVREAILARVQDTWRGWSVDEMKTFLRAVQTTRPDEYVPPIPMLNLDAIGTRDRSNDEQKIGVKTRILRERMHNKSE